MEIKAVEDVSLKFLPTEVRQDSQVMGLKEVEGPHQAEPSLLFLPLRSGHGARMYLVFGFSTIC